MSVLTAENVHGALSLGRYWSPYREQVHPVLYTLFTRGEELKRFSANYNRLGKKEAEEFLKASFGFFIDAIEEARAFTLNPLEIIAIWSRVRDLNLPRYETSRFLSLGYALQPLPQETWKGVSKYWLKECAFPKEVKNRNRDLRIILHGLGTIGLNLEAIEEYASGVEGGISAFVKAMQSGDKTKAAEMIEKQQERRQQPDMEFLGIISENFSNGILPIKLSIQKMLLE